MWNETYCERNVKTFCFKNKETNILKPKSLSLNEMFVSNMVYFYRILNEESD